MIRKSILALTALTALGAAALAPTSASAWGFKGGWGHHGWNHGIGFYGAGYGYGYGARYVDFAPSCYYVKRVNRFGELRLIRVCN